MVELRQICKSLCKPGLRRRAGCATYFEVLATYKSILRLKNTVVWLKFVILCHELGHRGHESSAMMLCTLDVDLDPAQKIVDG